MGVNYVDTHFRTDVIQRKLEDTSTTGVIYVGLTPDFSTPEDRPLWQIQRKTYRSNGVTETLYADYGKYNNSWADRASYFPALPGDLAEFPSDGTSTISGSIENAQIQVSTAVELKATASRLVGRKILMFQPLNGTIWVGKDNTVTSLTGQKYLPMQIAYLPISDAVGVFAKADTGTVTVSIMEMS